MVWLLKSQFKERLETFYFPYPEFCMEEKPEGKRVIRLDQEKFTSCITFLKYNTDMHIYNAVVRAWNEAGIFLKDK
jgi:uncharacterized membrane protein